MLKILFKFIISLRINKLLFKLTSLLIIQFLLLGNIAIAADNVIFVKNEKQNLSPRICIDNNILTNMFINGFPESGQDSKSKTLTPGLLERLTQYALRKKQEDAGNGLLRQDIVYLMLKKRVDRIESRGTPYNLKAKKKKEFHKEVNRLKRLFGQRRKWIDPDLAQAYDNQINSLEPLLDKVKTQGDWDDLIAFGSKLSKALLKHGALAHELASWRQSNKKKKTPCRVSKNKKKPNVPKDITPQINSGLAAEIPEQPAPDLEEIKPELEPDQAGIFNTDGAEKAARSEGFVQLSVSARKPVLEKALEKLIEVYDASYKDLPAAIAFDFQNKIEQLRKSIADLQKGGFSACKKELRAIESDLLKAIENNNNVMTARLQERENSEIADAKEQDNETTRKINAKKQVKPVDPFSQAVTLCDPIKVQLRSADDVINELQGQIDLIDQVIDAEMLNSMELSVYNIRSETDRVVIQVNFSEALEKLEVGSDIIMELGGEIHSLKCDKILHAGSKLLLKPLNPDNFPRDISKAKFVYMPSTYSEDIQKETLKLIIKEIKGQGKSTGILVLDYLFRIKSAVRDIADIKELKEFIAYTDGMDMFQKAAVNMIVKTKFGLILGPFGTGKTSVLLAGAKNIILKNKKPVLIIAPQHKIADDITLKAGECQIPVLRCGNNIGKINPEVLAKYSRHSQAAQIEFKRRYKELNQKERDNGCLFVGTDMGASLDSLLKQLRNPESAAFLKDVTLIVDEAALINYPELVAAVYLLRPDALILVGDHVQFSPYKLAARFSNQIMDLFQRNIPQKAIYRFHISSFKELIPMQFNKVSLLINYRNPWISIDLLKEWYQGVLNLWSISKQRGDRIDEDTFIIEDTSIWEKQSFSETYNHGSSYCNKTEALWILKRIKYFLAKGNSAADITIITYYNGQIRMISDLIDADGDISSADAQILKQNIFTPISFQGGENKILLASLVRSEAKANGFGSNIVQRSNPVFLSEPEFAKTEALLVLLSRHKGMLNIIGNKDTLDALTKHRYQRINYLYSCLFNYKDKIKACLDIQNVELNRNREQFISRYDFSQSAI